MELIKIQEQLLKHPFKPGILGHHYFQTFLQFVLPYFKTNNFPVIQQHLTTKDGTQLLLEIALQKDFRNKPTVVVVDGFGGGSQSWFERGIGHKAYAKGYNAVLFNQRGQQNTLHLTKSLCDSGLEDDLQVVLETLKQGGHKEIFLVGMSYGGFLSLLTIGKLGRQAKELVKGLVLISSAVDIPHAWEFVQRHPFYRHAIVSGMRSLIKERATIDPPGTWDLSILKTINSVKDFDKAAMHTWGYPEKFKTVEEYYELVNVLPYAATISIPTLIIHAKDDPLLPAEPFQSKAFTTNPNIIELITNNGGHGGFVTFAKAYGDVDRHWAQNRAVEFIDLLSRP